MKKRSDFYHLRKKGIMVVTERAAEYFGVTIEDIENWDKNGAPVMAMKLLGLRYSYLAFMHPDWKGFRICQSGKMWGPNRNAFTAESLKRWDERHDETMELKNEIEYYKRQLENITGRNPAKPNSLIVLPPGVRI